MKTYYSDTTWLMIVEARKIESEKKAKLDQQAKLNRVAKLLGQRNKGDTK